MPAAAGAGGGACVGVRPAALHQHLLEVFLPGLQTRPLLRLPKGARQQGTVDMRPACFVKKDKLLDIGFVRTHSPARLPPRWVRIYPPT